MIVQSERATHGQAYGLGTMRRSLSVCTINLPSLACSQAQGPETVAYMSSCHSFRGLGPDAESKECTVSLYTVTVPDYDRHSLALRAVSRTGERLMNIL